MPKGPDGRGVGGFTLVELMLVMLLMTLFSAMVIPSVVSAVREDTVQTQGERLAEVLRFASLSAVTRHRTVQAFVDERRGTCRVALSNPALPWLEGYGSPKAQILSSMRLPDGMRLRVERGGTEGSGAAGEGPLLFRSDGRAEDAAITLTDRRGEEFAVRVSAADGSVETGKPRS